MKLYSGIITKRIRTSRFEPSLFEKGVFAAIDYHGAKEVFELLIATDDEYYLCNCIEKNGLLRINAMQSAVHNLGITLFNTPENKGLETCFQITDGMVSIDPMFENMIARQIKEIYSSLSSIKASGKGKLYLHGQLSESLLFRYALQKYYGVRELAIVDDEKPVKSDGRTLFPNSVFNEPLNLNIPDGLIVKYITKPGCQMMLPLTDATMKAKVWNSSPLTWGDIIPDREADLTIAGVECKSITLNFSIDIFGNIISRVYGSDGKKAVRLFKNAMDAEIETCCQPQKPETFKPGRQTNKRQAEKAARTEQNPRVHKAENTIVSTNAPKYKFDEKFVAKSSEINGLTNGTITILENEEWSYEQLFGKYLAGAVEIYLEDPYIANYYQVNNLRHFINTAIKVSKLKRISGLERFHLVTCPDGSAATNANVETDSPQKPGHVRKSQVEMLNELVENLKNVEHIHFTYSFVKKGKKHDRFAKLSNGWFIHLGRGLDIYQKEDKLGRRLCREGEISIVRIENNINPIDGIQEIEIK